MSDMAEKLEPPQPSAQTPARRKLSTLRGTRGFVILQTRDGVAEVVRIACISGTWAWRRVTPGVDGLFEFLYARGQEEDE